MQNVTQTAGRLSRGNVIESLPELKHCGWILRILALLSVTSWPFSQHLTLFLWDEFGFEVWYIFMRTWHRLLQVFKCTKPWSVSLGMKYSPLVVWSMAPPFSIHRATKCQVNLAPTLTIRWNQFIKTIYSHVKYSWLRLQMLWGRTRKHSLN